MYTWWWIFENESKLEDEEDEEIDDKAQDAYDQLYEESSKLIETISEQQAKITKLKDSLTCVKNEKRFIS